MTGFQAQIKEKGDLVDKIVAVVGEDIILYSEVEIQALQAAQGGDVNEAMYCNIMEESLFQKVLLHQAKLDSLEVGDEMVNDEVNRRLAQYIQIFGSQEAMIEYYKKSIEEWKEEFKDPVREQLMAQQMEQQLFGNVRVTPAEVREYYESVPKDSLPLINSTLEYSMIKLAPTVSDELVEETKNLLDSIRVELLNLPNPEDIPGDFGIKAALLSEDPGSKYKGGCYPIQKRGSFVPEYEAAVYNTPVGSISNVFETIYGYHMVLVKDIQGNNYESCHILMSPKPSEEDIMKSDEKIKEVYELMQTDSLTFNTAASQYSTDEKSKNQNGKVISNYSGSSKLDIQEIDQSVFFILDQMDPGEYSEPVYLQLQGDNSYAWYIFKLDKRNEAHTANVVDDYQIFKSQTENINKRKALDKWVNNKIKETYIWIDEDLRGCDYKFDWNYHVKSANNN